ncbi:MAG TPA: Na+/H+ antiporter [Usitatibacteraceae bacterium]|nr:Na+/H+ antiporter [Usitatibacteraceae bacterium]
MEVIQFTLVLLLLTAVSGALVRWTRLPLPAFLVIVGAAASFLPGLDHIDVNPEVFLLLFLPPLLFADARVLPRRDLLRVIKPVLGLALGLVVLTVVCVGYFIHWMVPSIPLAVAFTLGAIVSPTDAVATVATTSLLPLPARVTYMVNAESLINDATGLVAFKLAVAAAAAASTVTFGEVGQQFLLLSGGGVLVGIGVEWLGRKLREAVLAMGGDDPVLQVLLMLMIPYAAYLIAETLHVSGILAVVTSGLWAGGQEVKGLSADGRRHAREVWRLVGYVFNGLVFVLLGLQLRHMVAGAGPHGPLELALWAVALWALLMALRFGWVWSSAWLRFKLKWGWSGGHQGPDNKRLFLLSWAAVRGSITLATALSVPLLTTSGAPLPERGLVVFLAAATIILTLGVNGLTFPWFIRRLDTPGDGGEMEEKLARAEMARSAIEAITPAMARLADTQDREYAENLVTRYEGIVAMNEAMPGIAELNAQRVANARSLRLAGIEAERACLRGLASQNLVNDEVFLLLEEELDEREMIFSKEPNRG